MEPRDSLPSSKEFSVKYAISFIVSLGPCSVCRLEYDLLSDIGKRTCTFYEAFDTTICKWTSYLPSACLSCFWQRLKAIKVTFHTIFKCNSTNPLSLTQSITILHD